MKKAAESSSKTSVGPTVVSLLESLKEVASAEKAKQAARFFKTAPGEYGESDHFLGVTVPEQRTIAKRFGAMPLSELEQGLKSPWHEVRLTSLLVLVHLFTKAKENKEMYLDFYLANLRGVNNWDLVDSSAPKILGVYAIDHPKSRKIMHELVATEDLWKQRIGVVANIPLIKRSEFTDILKICQKLLGHHHDLIHKATGWMLREVGDQSQEAMTLFLDRHVEKMPRTMLRYAIEKLPPKMRSDYLSR